MTDYVANGECGLMSISTGIPQGLRAFVFRKNFPFLETFNRAFATFTDATTSDILAHGPEKQEQPQTCFFSSQTKPRLVLRKLYGVIGLLFMGSSMALSCFLVEMVRSCSCGHIFHVSA